MWSYLIKLTILFTNLSLLRWKCKGKKRQKELNNEKNIQQRQLNSLLIIIIQAEGSEFSIVKDSKKT